MFQFEDRPVCDGMCVICRQAGRQAEGGAREKVREGFF